MFWTNRARSDVVGADFVPFTHSEAVRLKEEPYLYAIPFQDLFEDGDQDTERIVTERRAACDLSDVLVFRNSDSAEPVG